MKTMHKMLLITAMLATPFAAAQAQNTRAGHEAWLKAQKIDIQPTLKITETKIPADSTGTSTGNGMSNPGSSMPAAPNTMPSMPGSSMPSSGAPMGTPSAPPPSTPYGAPK